MIKKCGMCEKEFYVIPSRKDIVKYCSVECYQKSCIGRKVKLKNRVYKDGILIEKKCNICNNIKPINEFGILKNSSDKYHYYCKKCLSLRAFEQRKRTIEKRKDQKLKRLYGISIQDKERLSNLQNDKCAICGKNNIKLYVDHCHKTNNIRGLLCHNCNIAIGCLKDNYLNAYNLYIYLIKQRKK